MTLNINKKSISEQIAAHFREEIEKGKYMPGDAFPSERQIESEIGISRKTVNKAISILAGQGYVFKEQGKSTFVADWRKSIPPIKTSDAGDIGLVFDSPLSVSHPYPGLILDKICRKLNERRLGIKLLFHEGGAPGEQFWEDIQRSGLKGLFMFFTISLPDDAVFRTIAATGLPVVTFNKQLSFHAGADRFSRFYADEEEALCDAVQLLVKRKHKRIAFLYGIPEWEGEQIRMKVFREAIAKTIKGQRHGLLFPTRYDHAQAMIALNDALSHNPDALICADDMVARWVIDALKVRRIKVPNELSVVGFNDMELYSLREPPLTTFRYPGDAIAEYAVEKMLSYIADGQTPEAKGFAYLPVIRQTVKI